MEAIMGCYLIPVTGEMFGVVDPQRGSCSRGGNALICSPRRSERRVDNEMNPRYNTQWLQSGMEIWLILIYCRGEERQTNKSLDSVLLHLYSHQNFCKIHRSIGCFIDFNPTHLGTVYTDARVIP